MKITPAVLKKAEKIDDEKTAGKKLNRKDRRFLAAVEKKVL